MTNHEMRANELDGRIIELLYMMDLGEDVTDFPIGFIQSDDEAHDSSEVIAAIDRLLSEIGSDKSWFDLYVGGSVSSLGLSNLKLSTHDKVHFKLEGVGTGQFITGLVYDMLPIESSHEGESAVRMAFAVGDEYILDIKGEGTYDTSYIFEGGVENDEEDNFIGSELHYQMKFSADLLHCPTA